MGKVQQTTNQFHELYYNSLVWRGYTHWLGVPIQKCPLDLWIYQEIIYSLKPDIIIECGTADGGSALYLAGICELIGKGRVITIDINNSAGRPSNQRILYLTGSSVSKSVVKRVRSEINPQDIVLVILDSDHRKEHVLTEMRIYGGLVSRGSYMIVEDTNINGHPVYSKFGPGPAEAVEDFLKETKKFVQDRSWEKFFLSFNPKGFLKKIKQTYSVYNIIT